MDGLRIPAGHAGKVNMRRATALLGAIARLESDIEQSEDLIAALEAALEAALDGKETAEKRVAALEQLTTTEPPAKPAKKSAAK